MFPQVGARITPQKVLTNILLMDCIRIFNIHNTLYNCIIHLLFRDLHLIGGT